MAAHFLLNARKIDMKNKKRYHLPDSYNYKEGDLLYASVSLNKDKVVFISEQEYENRKFVFERNLKRLLDVKKITPEEYRRTKRQYYCSCYYYTVEVDENNDILIPKKMREMDEVYIKAKEKRRRIR